MITDFLKATKFNVMAVVIVLLLPPFVPENAQTQTRNRLINDGQRKQLICCALALLGIVLLTMRRDESVALELKLIYLLFEFDCGGGFFFRRCDFHTIYWVHENIAFDFV